MAEIRDYSTAPDPQTAARWPEGMAMSAVNDTGRVDEGIIARWYQDTRGSLASTGSANAYVLATSRSFTGGYNGLVLNFKANFTNDDAATLEVTGGVVATAILTNAGDALTGGEIRQDEQVQVMHNGTNWVLLAPDTTLIPNDRTTSRSQEVQATLMQSLIDVTDPDYGVPNDGSAASTEIQAMFDASSPNDAFWFNGTFGIDAEITLPDAHPIHILGAGVDTTTFIALGVISNVFNKASTTEIQRPSYRDFTINCDRLADRAITIGASNEALFENVRVYRHLTEAIYLGDGGTAGSRGGTFFNVNVDGDVNENIVRAQTGIYCDSLSADNKFLRCTIKYCGDAGFQLIGTSNNIVDCHIFGGPTKCIRASANTVIVGCFIDTPDDVGVEVNAVGCVINGNRFFANTSGPYFNANAVGIRLVGGARNVVVSDNFFRFLDREIDFGSAFKTPGLSWGNSSSDITTGTSIALNFLTDDLTIKGDNDATAKQMIMRVQAGQEARWLLQTLGNRRWQIFKDGVSEGGANAGSNLNINRYTDGGGFLGTSVSVRRDTGELRALEGFRQFGDLGFYGITAKPQPTITGSRGGNAALTSLLTELASLGLIIDNST